MGWAGVGAEGKSVVRGGIYLPHSGLLLGVGNRSRSIEIIW